MNWLTKAAEWLRRQTKKLPWSRHNLRRIEGLSPDQVQRLRDAFPDQEFDQEALQKKIDGYPGSVFHDLAQRTQLNESVLAGAVGQSLKLWSRRSLWLWAMDHWADWVLLAVLAVLITDYVLPLGPTYRVNAAGAIPPLHRIERGDLEEVLSPGQTGETVDQYAGRYAGSRVPKGKDLSSADLSPDLATIRIETKSSIIPANAALPQMVTLVLSSRKQPPDGLAMPAVLLKIEAAGNAQIATLQIASKQQAELAKLIGSADVWIISAGP